MIERNQNSGSARHALGGLNEQAIKATRENEIPERLKELAGGIGSLDEITARLVDRLSPVVRPSQPDVGQEAKKAGTVTPLGDQLQVASDRLFNIYNRLSDALNRLEI